MGSKLLAAGPSALLLSIAGAVAMLGGNLPRASAAQALGQVQANVNTVTSAQLAKMLEHKDFFFVNCPDWKGIRSASDQELRQFDALLFRRCAVGPWAMNALVQADQRRLSADRDEFQFGKVAGSPVRAYQQRAYRLDGEVG